MFGEKKTTTIIPSFDPTDKLEECSDHLPRPNTEERTVLWWTLYGLGQVEDEVPMRYRVELQGV